MLGQLMKKRISIYVGFVIFALSIGTSLSSANNNSNSFVVDLPHGGCALTVAKNGSGEIHYGAMPKWIHVKPGTFNYDNVLLLLQAKAKTKAATSPNNKTESGSVTFPDQVEVRFIDDSEFIRNLLLQAWNARIPPKDKTEQEHYISVANACVFGEMETK
jgi:hypothetical protein